jgi:transcription elongation factor Elf1
MKQAECGMQTVKKDEMDIIIPKIQEKMEGQMDYTVNLNEKNLTAVLNCPYCGKSKVYIYNATGSQSSQCGICKRMVLWDFNLLKAYKVNARNFNA